MEGPKITWTELSLLIKIHLKMGKPSMWYWCIVFQKILCFQKFKSLYGWNGSHHFFQTNTELITGKVSMLIQNALNQIK